MGGGGRGGTEAKTVNAEVSQQPLTCENGICANLTPPPGLRLRAKKAVAS